ncbi:hypothetical protein [Methanosarcina lacustris]|uniref:hypothetical protein n=1 Tax=Methanosarcina lacustris TaxID=170861 RepID=UPI0012F65BDC|nr:hypothetical protein [Methanosarcina lacustris]
MKLSRKKEIRKNKGIFSILKIAGNYGKRFLLYIHMYRQEALLLYRLSDNYYQ